MAATVFVVDDDADLLPALVEIIEASGWSARGFSSGAMMLAELRPDWDGVILSDIRMPGMTGLELMARVRQLAPDVPFILFTAHGDIASAVAAIRGGAFDFLEKHSPPDYLRSVIGRALEKRRLEIENQRLKERIASGDALKSRLPGKSELMRELRRELAAVAKLDVPVLLTGEQGTGKVQAALAVHDMSEFGGEFVTVDCAGLSEANFDAVMLGEDSHPGAIRRACGGTLHLSRISALSADLQMRLVGLMDGGKVDFPRLISTAEGPLASIRADRQLTEMLFYRIALAEIELPPLRLREEDVPQLLAQFLRDACARHGRAMPALGAADLRPYRRYHWPGNLRELRNVAEKLVIGLRVVLQQGRDGSGAAAPDALGYDGAMQEFESSLLQSALQRTGGRKTEAAEALGIPRKRLYLRLRACGLLETGQN